MARPMWNASLLAARDVRKLTIPACNLGVTTELVAVVVGSPRSSEHDPPMTPDRRAHRRVVAAILVVATLVGFISLFAVWAKRQLLETSTYTETSTQLLENEDIRNAVAGFLV